MRPRSLLEMAADRAVITGLHDGSARIKAFLHHAYSLILRDPPDYVQLGVDIGSIGGLAVAVMRHVDPSLGRDQCLDRVSAEWEQALKEHGHCRTLTEALGILDEEIDELWDLTKQKSPHPSNVLSEATQVAAMVIRFLVTMRDDANAEAPTC